MRGEQPGETDSENVFPIFSDMFLQHVFLERFKRIGVKRFVVFEFLRYLKLSMVKRFKFVANVLHVQRRLCNGEFRETSLESALSHCCRSFFVENPSFFSATCTRPGFG